MSSAGSADLLYSEKNLNKKEYGWCLVGDAWLDIW